MTANQLLLLVYIFGCVAISVLMAVIIFVVKGMAISDDDDFKLFMIQLSCVILAWPIAIPLGMLIGSVYQLMIGTGKFILWAQEKVEANRRRSK